MTRRLLAFAAAVLLPLAAVHAAGLVVTKSSSVVSDAVSTLNPKALPGATVDYSLVVENTNGLLSGTVVRQVVITDTIAPGVKLYVGDYGAAGSGPIEFADGNLLGTGLLSSGVSLTYRGLADTTDGIEFSDGTSWSYRPVSTGGYDANVRAVRVTLSGTQIPTSRFRLRYRVVVR